MKHPTDFTRQVIRIIKEIPRGKVATYGQIAQLAGKPHAARAVAWILHSCSKSHRLPWHRVIGAKGTISFPRGSANYREQKKKLRTEGVTFLEGNRLDLDRYQWIQRRGSRARKLLQPRVFSDD